MKLFKCKLISNIECYLKNRNVNQPTRSWDLTLLDYFLWGYMKHSVYKNNPQSIPELENDIIRIIGEIESQLWSNAFENFNKQVCKRWSFIRNCFSYINAISLDLIINKKSKLCVLFICLKKHLISNTPYIHYRCKIR